MKLLPIDDRVFAIRDPEEDEMMGFKVGDGAKVKSLNATVAFSGSNLVKPGDRIHLPHQMAKILDYEIDGQEYACVRAGDLFAVEKDGVYLPINRYVKIRKCENDHVRDDSGNIALYMTENHIEETEWVEILDFSEDCREFPRNCIGWFCLSPENDERLQRDGRSKDYFLHEELIPFVTDGE